MGSNGTSNGHAPAASELREQVRQARLANELRRLQAEGRLLEMVGPYGMGGSYGLDFYDYPGYSAGSREWLPTPGSRSDRQDGANRPAVWTETQLDWMRSQARWLANFNLLANGALDGLADYTVRTGYSYEAKPGRRFVKDQAAHELAAQVQEVVEEFQLLNTYGEGGPEEYAWADREREAVVRSVVDGDAFLRGFAQDDGTTLVRFVEPEQVRKPEGEAPHYSYGVLTDPRDVERRLAYAVHHDQTHYQEVPASEVVHFRNNVVSTVKRGLSDFFAAGELLDQVSKLLRNMAVGGAATATIPWVEVFETASQEALSRNVGAIKNINFPPPLVRPDSGRTTSYQRREPGEVLKVGGGRQFLPPPLAANTGNYVQIAQACLRALGARWRMPEYMISGDASNANYSSTLVSGAPFVVAVECRQARYGRFFVRVLWLAIGNAADAGRFVVAGHRYTREEVSRLVDVTFTPPSVAIANHGEEASIDHQDIAAGVLSIQTRRARRGLDDDTERSNLREEPPSRVAGKATDVNAQGDVEAPEQDAGAAAGDEGDPELDALLAELQGLQAGGDEGDTLADQTGAGEGAAALRATVGGSTALAALQKAYYGGELPREAAVANARLVFGFDPAEADALFPPVPPVKLQPEGADAGADQPPPLAEGLLEAVIPNKTGPGCHDDQTGHRARCAHQDAHDARKAAEKKRDRAEALHRKAEAKLAASAAEVKATERHAKELEADAAKPGAPPAIKAAAKRARKRADALAGKVQAVRDALQQVAAAHAQARQAHGAAADEHAKHYAAHEREQERLHGGGAKPKPRAPRKKAAPAPAAAPEPAPAAKARPAAAPGQSGAELLGTFGVPALDDALAKAQTPLEMAQALHEHGHYLAHLDLATGASHGTRVRDAFKAHLAGISKKELEAIGKGLGLHSRENWTPEGITRKALGRMEALSRSKIGSERGERGEARQSAQELRAAGWTGGAAPEPPPAPAPKAHADRARELLARSQAPLTDRTAPVVTADEARAFAEEVPAAELAAVAAALEVKPDRSQTGTRRRIAAKLGEVAAAQRSIEV